MLIENSEALKKYLMESLARISDADPGALSKYILALLKKPRSEDDLKVFFLDQLEVFLMKDTAKFVDQLFEAIKSKSYLQTSIPKQEKSETSEIDHQNIENLKSKRRGKNSGAESYSKKNMSSSMRSRSNSPEKTGREREKEMHLTHIKEKLKEGSTLLQNREAMPIDKLPSESVHSLINTVTPEYTVQTRNEKLSIRCKDYDERGYCLLGDSCPFNHGLDPVIVDDVSALGFAMLNDNARPPFSVCERKESPLPPPPPPLPPLPPPPLPPTSPPPLPLSLPVPGIAGYIPEPYNPECPAMGQQKGDNDTYYNIPLQRPFQVPSHVSNQPQSSMQIRAQNSKPVRSRELIGVPTVDKNEMQSAARKRKGGFDYSRLGPKPKRIVSETTTIELRRVPQALNSITTLHDHFSRFGKIMNIQVCYDDDPEASLITFSTFAEANAAYRSTEAVLNNRFIKVFLHNINKRVDKNMETEKEGSSNDTFMKKDNVTHSVPQKNFPVKKNPNESVVFSKGNLSKTLFLNKINNTKPEIPSVPVASQVKGPKAEKKNAPSKLELFKKKQEMLEKLIQHQKLIFEHLKTARNPKQREALKKIIDELSSKIASLEFELKRFFEKEKTISQNPKAMIAEKKKELLDAEMDLYKTLNKGDENDTNALLMKVRELKEKAKELGLLDTSYGKTAVRRKLVKTNVHNFPQKPVASFSNLLKTDNRPKSLLVSGIEDKDMLTKFLQKFPGVEKISTTPKGCAVILNTRKAAEAMHHSLNGFKLGNEGLTVSWFHGDQSSVSEDVKDAKEENDNSHLIDGEEDEDEEEDSEARSWRR